MVATTGLHDCRRVHSNRGPLRLGYVPALIPLVRESSIESPLDEDDITYFLSKMELHRGDLPGMSRWRKRLFLATSHLTADATEYFKLPRAKTVIMGSRIEV
jgi:KUP system potassium uptake protein